MAKQSYATESGEYWQRSWKGVLPLPAGKKFPPPDGYTGYSGAWPSFPDVMAWGEDFPEGNLALRLPNFVVGIDVDAYNGKRGDLTLAEAEKRWGELPPTVRSTSRITNPSGIRLYRVPPGTELETVIRFPEMGLGHIEVIQFFHRYCVAWPSVHPETQRQYLWVNPDGSFADIPRPHSLPLLPQGWLEGLKRRPQAEITTEGDAENTLKNLPAGPTTLRVDNTCTQAIVDLQGDPGSRHDVTLGHIGRLLRWADEGDGGVAEALGKLRDEFVKVVGRDRGLEAAKLEFDRMLKNRRIHDLIASTPGQKKADELIGIKHMAPTPVVPIHPEAVANIPDEVIDQAIREQQHVLDALAPHDGMTPEAEDFLIFGKRPDSATHGTPAFPEPTEDELIFGTAAPTPALYIEEEEEGSSRRRTSWGSANIAEALAGDLSPEEPLALMRADEKFLMYKGRVNALAGEPGSGKSWLAQVACAQVLINGGRAFYLDFEDNLKAVLLRLVGLGVPTDVLIERFGYADPDGPLDSDASQDLADALEWNNPDVAVVDGVNAAMGMVGLDMEKTHDFNKFNDILLRPLARRGCTVITVDHVPKSRDNRNGYAIGSQAKKAMCDGVLLSVRAKDKFGRGKKGLSEIYIDKDKNGGVQGLAESRKGGDYLASFSLDARTPNMSYQLWLDEKEVDENGIPTGDDRLITMYINICKYLAEADEKGFSQTNVEKFVTGKGDAIRGALRQLVERGNVRLEKRGQGSYYTLVKPFADPRREASEDEDEAIFGTPSQGEDAVGD